MPTPEEKQAAMDEFTAHSRLYRLEGNTAVECARPALERLAKVMCERSGQPYKIRALLYSLWNGKPTSICDLVCLDWALRKDLLAVFLAFGFSDQRVEFFYDAIREAVTAAGQWDWFQEERLNIQPLEDYVKGVEKPKNTIL